MLIIFDTATKPDYYKDVHRVLALPVGAIIRYDYERRLWSAEAQAEIAAFSAQAAPIPALLIYGQDKDYKKGDPDPRGMLTQKNAFFVPTRFAHIVNYAVEPNLADRERENLNIHLQLDGFVDPTTEAIDKLIAALEAKDELPFDRDRGYIWVSKCPEGVSQEALSENDEGHWPAVIDRFASKPSQFAGDVFWRVLDFDRVTQKGANAKLKLKSRVSNTFGDLEKWNRDFPLSDIEEYSVSIKNHIPVAEDRELPPNAVIAAREDTTSRLQLPDHQVALERNRVARLKVGVADIDFSEEKYAELRVHTETGTQEDHGYPPGSLVELTVSLSKDRQRLVAGVILGGISVLALGAAAALFRQNLLLGFLSLLVGVIAGGASYWTLTGKIKVSK